MRCRTNRVGDFNPKIMRLLSTIGWNHQQQRNVRPVRQDASGALGARAPSLAKSLHPTDVPTYTLVWAEQSLPPRPRHTYPSHPAADTLNQFTDFLSAHSFHHVTTMLDPVS